eukprot:g59646.t1
MADPKTAFSVYDSKGEGKLDKEDTAACLRACGTNPTDPELKQHIYPKVDEAGGSCSFDLFQSILNETKSRESANVAEAILEEAFKVFDKDAGGTVSSSELRHVMMNLGEKLAEEEVTEILKAADINGDTEIDLPEFLKIFKPV